MLIVLQVPSLRCHFHPTILVRRVKFSKQRNQLHTRLVKQAKLLVDEVYLRQTEPTLQSFTPENSKRLCFRNCKFIPLKTVFMLGHRCIPPQDLQIWMQSSSKIILGTFYSCVVL